MIIISMQFIIDSSLFRDIHIVFLHILFVQKKILKWNQLKASILRDILHLIWRVFQYELGDNKERNIFLQIIEKIMILTRFGEFPEEILIAGDEPIASHRRRSHQNLKNDICI